MADVGVTEEGIVVAGVLVMTWEEVDQQRNLFRFKDRVLVKVGFAYSRGDWYDHTLFKKAEWENIKSILTGKTAYFSDFAGKHSEASITFFEDLELEEITDRDAIIDFHGRNGYSDSNLDIIYTALEQLWEGGEIDRKDSVYYPGGTIPEDEQN